VNVNRKLELWAIILAFILAAFCVWGGPVLRLSWNASAGADGYRVYAGTNSRDYLTNYPAAETSAPFEVPDLGRWWFAVRSERGAANGTNFAASALSDEVSFEWLQAPILNGTNCVRLVPVFQFSADLVLWRRATGAAMIWPATGAAGFFRAPEITLEPVRVP